VQDKENNGTDFMDIHEYQAKQILRHYGVSIPEFAIASTQNEVLEIIKDKGWETAVLKIQVHAGGRGKAGGVKIACSNKELQDFASQLIGMKIVNNQTGPKGIIARQIMLTPLVDVKREYYLGAVIDRKKAEAMLILSPEGGMDIEEIAEKYSHKILKIPITNSGTIRNYNLLRIVDFMGWTGKLAEQGKALALAIAKAFVDIDASLLEINPLVETAQGDLVALDAKISVDDNALFRQKEIASFYDPTQLPEAEREAKVFDLAYIALDGNIGCMVNGAGLAMATMDLIQLAGGKPANFLDVGGGASEEKVAAGFKIILSDPNVKAILVNIFGGIMNCETLAAGIVSAAGQLKLTVPLIVRMEGTNVEQGRKLLKESGLGITIAASLDEAAKLAVAAAKGRK
jgi:succinyl-CoA synthetase beta subunit